MSLLDEQQRIALAAFQLGLSFFDFQFQFIERVIMTDLPDLDGFEASFRFACAMADEFGIQIGSLLAPVPKKAAHLRLVAVDGRRIDNPENVERKI